MDRSITQAKPLPSKQIQLLLRTAMVGTGTSAELGCPAAQQLLLVV